jgi:O-acetyl-ADP-ribose deacetylase
MNMIARRLRQLFSRHPRIEVVKGDITKERVDAIVNAAKSSLMGGGGVDGAIHRAGGPAILDQCRKIREFMPHGLPVGDAVVTTAGRLPAKHVIHTVGPRYADTHHGPALRACYTSSLAAADRVGAKTVAFPLISSGVYGWPVHDALRQAFIGVLDAKTKVRTVRLVLFDENTYRAARRMLTWMEMN